MRITRAYIDHELHAGQRLRLPVPVSRHFVRVLRLGAKDLVVLFNGDGKDYPGEILEVGREEVLVRIAAPGETEPHPPLDIRIGIGVSKGERMNFSLQKSVELGVSAITPLFVERSPVRLSGERLAKREARWRAVVVAACEQSGRRRLPQLNRSEPLETWLKIGHPSPLLLDPNGQKSLPDLAPPGDALTLLIGPEGGIAPGERRHADDAGFTLVRLGPRILRTETAPLAALAIIQALWGDLRDERKPCCQTGP